MPALPWQQAYKWQTFAYKHVHTQPFHSGIFLTLQSSSWSAPAAKPRLAMLQQHLDIFIPTAASEGKDTAFVPVLWVLLGRQTTRRFPCLTRKKKNYLFSIVFLLLLFSHLQMSFYWSEEGNTWLIWEENWEYLGCLPHNTNAIINFYFLEML